MKTSGSGRSDSWMLFIPLGVLLIFVSFASGGPASLAWSLDSVVRGAVRSVTELISSLF